MLHTYKYLKNEQNPHLHAYTYMYIERERDIYIRIYTFTHTHTHTQYGPLHTNTVWKQLVFPRNPSTSIQSEPV
jgi:hypothetical protein